MWQTLKGWKTVIINVVTGVPFLILSILDMLNGVDVAPLFPPEWGPRVIAGLAVLNVVLRCITHTGVGRKD
jgi:hypothetical protein